MKKIISLLTIFILINIIFIDTIKAKELDITNDAHLEYKWYTEEKVDGTYHLKGEELEGYFEDPSKIKYGSFTDWHYRYCHYSPNQYIIERQTQWHYKDVPPIRFVKITNYQHDDLNIHFYYERVEKDYRIIKRDDKEIYLDLKGAFYPLEMALFIDSKESYDIFLISEQFLQRPVLWKHIEDNKILIPDETWIYPQTTYIETGSPKELHNNCFRHLNWYITKCRVKEIQTYRYKIKRNYYDDNYHTNIANYYPDFQDFRIKYTGVLPTKTITVTNKVEYIVPKKEYVYIKELSPSCKKKEQSNLDHPPDNKTETVIPPKPQIKYIKKEVIKEVKVVPPKIYIIILILGLLVFGELILLIKKKVD